MLELLFSLLSFPRKRESFESIREDPRFHGDDKFYDQCTKALLLIPILFKKFSERRWGLQFEARVPRFLPILIPVIYPAFRRIPGIKGVLYHLQLSSKKLVTFISRPQK